ncbi:hypothetical protein BROC_01652 [Candidatus Brocadiaceae bacterium]|nr:hypothetical protein BROC_01652 [Candidatus Brocadiaceae bacterium]
MKFFEENGYEITNCLISIEQVDDLLSLLSKQNLPALKAGMRRINKIVPEVEKLANSQAILSIAQQYLTGVPRLVRAIYFDKSFENNWYVTWHQDKTVAVSKQFDLPDWHTWSIKSGVWHVQPPLKVLQQMVTVRIHLDAANKNNGCLKIITKSHLLGILSTESIEQFIYQSESIYCEVKKGGAVIMRPHILHASEKSVNNLQRRVLHFEYSCFQLPEGIEWGE